MQKKYLGVIFASFCLVSCASQVAKLPKYDHFQRNPQFATVVVRLNNFDYLDLKRITKNDDETSLQTHSAEKQNMEQLKAAQVKGYDLRKLITPKQLDLTTNEFRIMKPARSPIPYSYSQSLYTIKPGIYYISYMAILSDQGVYYTEAAGLSPRGEIAYGAFEIKAGEVLYIGDLDAQWKSSNLVKKISVLDQLTQVKKDLTAAGHADLAAKITKAQFYAKGEMLPAYDNMG